MPLSKPVLVYTLLQSFIAPWTDFIFAKVNTSWEADFYENRKESECAARGGYELERIALCGVSGLVFIKIE